MTHIDLEALKSELWERRREVFGRIQKLDEEWHTLSEPEIEIVDAARKAELTDLFNRLDQQDQDRVDDIDLALERIEEGTYGFCEECGKEIPLARLRALPATRLCVKCSMANE